MNPIHGKSWQRYSWPTVCKLDRPIDHAMGSSILCEVYYVHESNSDKTVINVDEYECMIVHTCESIKYTSYRNAYKLNLKLYESILFKKQIRNILKQL